MITSEHYCLVVKPEQLFFNMHIQNGIQSILEGNPIIPVITFDKVSDVDPTVNALIEKGIHCIEITLRTDVAFDSIERCKEIKQGISKLALERLCIQLKFSVVISLT